MQFESLNDALRQAVRLGFVDMGRVVLVRGARATARFPGDAEDYRFEEDSDDSEELEDDDPPEGWSCRLWGGQRWYRRCDVALA